MGRLEGKHWAVIIGFLGATAAVIVGLDHWGDLFSPKVAGGLIGQLAALLSAVFVGAPKNPNHDPLDNPGRRMSDPMKPAAGLLLILAVPAMLAATACGGTNPNPNATPRSQPAQVAIEADAVIKAADVVLTALDHAMEPTASPRLPTAIGLPVVKAIREVGVQGKNLAATLTVIKASGVSEADQATAAGKARQTLLGMRQLLTSALSPIKDAATKNQVNALLAGLVETLDKAQQIVDAVKGPRLQLQPAAY